MSHKASCKVKWCLKDGREKSTVDNWKKKKWYDVHADPTFDEKKIGETVAIVPKNLVGRNIKKALTN